MCKIAKENIIKETHMRLLFEWINCDEKEIFNDCGVNFTSDYVITYDSKSSTLKIDKKEK